MMGASAQPLAGGISAKISIMNTALPKLALLAAMLAFTLRAEALGADPAATKACAALAPGAKADCITSLIRKQPGTAHLFEKRAEAYAAQDKNILAARDYARAIELGAATAQNLEREGDLYMKAAQPGKASNPYAEALKLSPDNPRLHYKRGIAQLQLGQRDEAICSLSKAVNRNPSHTAALMYRAKALAELGLYRDAVADYDAAEKTAPRDYVIYMKRGGVRSLAGEYAEALADYDKAAALNRTDWLIPAGRGEAKLRLGRYAAAEADLKSALKLNPKAAPPHLSLARLAWLRGKAATEASRELALAAKNGMTPEEINAAAQDRKDPLYQFSKTREYHAVAARKFQW